MIVSGQEPLTALAAAIERGVAKQCSRHRLDYLWIPHLYHISESSNLWKKLADHAGKTVLLCWIHPRPAQWLLRRHGIANEELTILNLSSFLDVDAAVSAAVEAVQAGLRAHQKTKQGSKAEAPLPDKTHRIKEPTNTRWYPIIDDSRCINCRHCLQFCLFGVYELNAAGQVEVRNSDQCKPGCPACARICPQSAIMFPLYEKDPAIAGAPGQFVALDAAAHKMFYARTKQPCPLCGMKAEWKFKSATAAGPLCPECSRPQPVQTSITGSSEAAERPLFKDLDALVDRLDRQMQRRR
jgi:Pyruvate/2-oxoacid:ferredoxin oxidoreductase delta subunit